MSRSSSRIKSSRKLSWSFVFPYLVVVLALSVILTIFNISKNLKKLRYNQLAQSNYEELRSSLIRVIANRGGEQHLFFIDKVGPYSYPGGLQYARLEDGVHATLFHHTHPRTNKRAISVTRLEVFHPLGLAKYVFTDVNGVTTEQQTVLE